MQAIPVVLVKARHTRNGSLAGVATISVSHRYRLFTVTAEPAGRTVSWPERKQDLPAGRRSARTRWCMALDGSDP
jgi:hypothetical protein